jgi:FKBP-type peptidyl-prolyl cis-trans isomerase (trigger factor)
MYQQKWQRVSDASITPPEVRVAEQAMDRAMRKSQHHRAAWAYVEMAARGGDQAALDLMELVGGLK